MRVEIAKFKMASEFMPYDIYNVTVATEQRMAGEIINGELILSNGEQYVFEKGVVYRSVPIKYIDIVDSEIRLLHWRFQEVGMSGKFVRYRVV